MAFPLMVKTTINPIKECREYGMISIDLLRKRRWFAKPRARGLGTNKP